MIERNIPVFWVTSLRYIGTILPKRYARLLKVLLPCDLLNLQTMTASFVCCIIPHGAVGKKIFTSDSVTVDLNDDNASKLMDCETLQGNQNCSSFRPAEEVGGMEVLWSLLESKSYRCLESLNELISFLALPLHLTLLHLQKNTGIAGVLLTLRHFAKPSAKMQSACIWWICTP